MAPQTRKQLIVKLHALPLIDSTSPAHKSAQAEAQVDQLETAYNVLNTVELVNMIFEHLDELSLVRVQGVNKLFCAIVRDTKSFSQRIGFVAGCEKVFDSYCQAERNVVTWNPLLDWLTTRSFISREQSEGPIGRTGSQFMFHILPHTYRALAHELYDRTPSGHADKLVTSSLWTISVTLPPVNRITYQMVGDEIVNESSGRRSMMALSTLCDPKGVTIWAVLEDWAERTDGAKRFPMIMGIPPVSAQHYTHRFWTREIMLSLRAEVQTIFETILHAKIARECYDTCRNPSPLIWYYSEAKQGADWWEMSMREQTEALGKAMDLAKHQGWSAKDRETSEYPQWPALAWKPDGKEKAPYKVNYADGLVFNRQD